jgi:hypothetical protein
LAIDLYPRWEIRCILIVGLQHLEELYPSFPEMFPEVPAKLAFWRLPKRFARKVRIEPCHNPVQDSIMSFNECDSHPKMLYRVAAICRSVTEAGVFPFQQSHKEE